jgi:N-acetyl-gamma-glutamyl-phosphate reductase
MPSVAIVGASGYGGTELARLLSRHPALDVTALAAASNAGATLRSLAPNLPAGLQPFDAPADAVSEERRIDAVDPEQLAAADVVLLATPDEVSMALAPVLLAAGTRVVDLSGAFRLSGETYATWYGGPHTAPELANDGAHAAVYGLTEHARDDVRSARIVANPGCYPTATLLPLIPLLPLLEAEGIVVSAVSGTSGAGRSSRDALQATIVHGDVVAYGAPSHRHTAEIEAHAAPGGHTAPVVFTPHLVPMSRGILATMSAPMRPGVGQREVDEALRAAYGAEPFVHVLPAGQFPRTKSVHGSNSCQLSAVVDGRTGRVLVTSVIDNLVKGAAGQALQNTNLMLGLDETLGLEVNGVYP